MTEKETKVYTIMGFVLILFYLILFGLGILSAYLISQI